MRLCAVACAASQKWFDEYGHTTATSLRLCEPWFDKKLVVYGDSWFASVKLAEAFMQRGLYFMGDVKTNTKRFPSEALATKVSQL